MDAVPRDLGATLRRDGFCPAAPLPAGTLRPELQAEAVESREAADLTETHRYELHAEGQDMRSPVRYRLAPPGPELRRLHEDETLLALAAELAGTPMAPSKAGFLHYEAGDRIGVHTDLPACELTLLAVLDGSAPPLVVHPELAALPPEELAQVAEAANGAPAGGVELPVRPGAAVALLGGGLPHQTRPAPDGTASVVATLCYVAARP